MAKLPKGWRKSEKSPITMLELETYLKAIFVTRSNKERRQVKIGIYCHHVGHWITVGPDSWGCSECYYERVGKHIHEQDYLKADEYYTNKSSTI